MKYVLIALFAVVTASLVGAQAVDPRQILKQIDAQSNFDDTDFSANANLIIARKNKDKEGLSIKFFRRDKEEKFMILIDKPDVKRGQGYLKMDENVIFYDPNTRAFSHSSLRDSFSDSDSRNEDFGRSNLFRDYDVTEFKEEKLGKLDVYKISLKANADTVPTPFKIMWVDRGSVPLVRQEEDYSLSKRLMRTNRYKDYEQIGNRYIWKTALFVNNLVEGEYTQLSLQNINLGRIPDKVFTKTYLEQVSK